MESDGPASPAGSMTPTNDEPASPDIPTDQAIISPPGSGTPSPASPLSASEQMAEDGPASPEAEEVIEEPHSPSDEMLESEVTATVNDTPESPSETQQPSTDGPLSPIPEDTPQSPLGEEMRFAETSFETPQSPTDTPLSPADAPLSPTDAPLSPTDAPLSPTDAPLSPTDTPLSPTDAPLSPADTPLSPTDAPLSPEVDRAVRISPPESPTPTGTGEAIGDSQSDKGDKSSDVEDEKTTPTKSKRIDSSDSEGEETTPSGSGKRRLESSDSETEQSTPSKRKKILDSDDSDAETGEAKENPPDADGAGSDKGEGDGDVIADIFGDSSDEEGEFQGFDEEEIKSAAAGSALPEVSSDDELEDDLHHNKDSFVSDFDEMLAKKKEERSNSRRRKRNVDIINDSDDLIVDMLKRMKEAAEDDRNLNVNHQPATKKLTMLPSIAKQLNKSELQGAFMDCGVLSALTEWLAPLPDKSLPHLSVRQTLLKLLISLPHPDTDQLKSSGIGKAVMYLFKHPKELRSNRDIAGRLINEWSRPIFGQSSNFKSVNREDLQERDMRTLKNRRRSSEDVAKEDEEQRALRPGDPGWVYRARVPRPSNKDYVIRPESNVDPETTFSKGSGKRKKTRYEVQKQKMDNKKKSMKSLTAVKISIEGKNMAL